MHQQNTIIRKKGQHLTEIERGRIASLHELECSNRQIASIIGVSPQTINNEINRGTVSQVKKVNNKLIYSSSYFPDTAQTNYENNRLRCHRPSKFNQVKPFLSFFVEKFKDNKWSPDATVGRARVDGLFTSEEMVSTTTLYKYIDRQLLEIKNIDLVEKTHRSSKIHIAKKHRRTLGRSIEERPSHINNRERFGHFEIDTVVGKRNGNESVVLTLTERQSRFEIMRLIDGRDADSVDYAMEEIKLSYGRAIKSITADNGPEFANLERTMSDTCDVYFTHPYTSSERGTNEVHNRMIRRELPKSLSLDTVSPQTISVINAHLNELPRKQLGYKKPQEAFSLACGY